MQALNKLPYTVPPVCSLGRISGKYYTAGPGVPIGTNGTTALDTLHAVRFEVGNACTFDRISVNGLGTASSFVRLGIYADDNGRPGALIVDAGQVSTAGSGMADATISVTLSGVVWVATVPQGVAGSMTRYGVATCGQHTGTADHYSAFFNSIAYSRASVSGSLPNPFGPTYTDAGATNTIPVVWLRAK